VDAPLSCRISRAAEAAVRAAAGLCELPCDLLRVLALAARLAAAGAPQRDGPAPPTR
jgi:hypothetical protein